MTVFEPFHPPEEAAGSKLQHVWGWAVILQPSSVFIVLIISSFYSNCNLISHFPLFSIISLWSLSVLIASHLFARFSLALCICYPYHNPLISPFSFPLFYTLHWRYLCSSLHLMSHRGGDKRDSDDLCLIQPLHWAPLISSLVKCHRCVIVIKSYITGRWNVTLRDVTDLLIPMLQSFFHL